MKTKEIKCLSAFEQIELQEKLIAAREHIIWLRDNIRDALVKSVCDKIIEKLDK